MKPRPDSVWNRLPPEQRQLLEGWLFEQNLSYCDVLERAKKEFGVSASLSSLGAFYRRVAHERKSNSVEQAISWLSSSKHEGEELRGMEVALAHSMTIAAYDLALKPSEEMDVQKLSALTRILCVRRKLELREARLKLQAERAAKAHELALGKELRAALLFKAERDGEAAASNIDFATLDKCNDWLDKIGRNKSKKGETPQTSAEKAANEDD